MSFFRRKAAPQDDTAAMQALASQLDLTFAGRADEGYLAAMGPLPDLPLLREGNEGSIARLIYGHRDEVEVRMFDFIPVGHTDYAGDSRRSCVLFTFRNMDFPELYISPRARIQRLGEQLREGGISIGSPELMKKFQIQAHLRQHTTDLLGPDVEQWLLGCPLDGIRVEFGGNALLGHVPDLPGAEEFRTLLDFMEGFRSRIPEAAWSRYQRL